MIAPVWKGWEYPTERSAAATFELLLAESDSAQEENNRIDVGLWRSSTPDRRRHFIFLAGVEEDVERLAAKVHQGKRYDVPEELRGPLWTRHVAKVVGTYLETGDPIVSERTPHAGPLGGQFLHRDGTLHPFPEPGGHG